MAKDEFPVQVERSKENLYRVNLAGQVHDADVCEISPTLYSLILNDKSFELDVTERNSGCASCYHCGHGVTTGNFCRKLSLILDFLPNLFGKHSLHQVSERR